MKNKHKEIVEQLLVKEIDVCQANKADPWLLYYAAQNGETRVIRILLEKGFTSESSAYPKDGKGKTPLIKALENGHVEIVELFLKHIDINQCNFDDITLLQYAIKQGWKNIIPPLLKNGSKTDQKNRDGFTALSYAIYYGHKDILALLLEQETELNQPEGSGTTPLQQAIAKGNIEIVTLLLDKGAKVDYPGNNGKAPLQQAIAKGDKEIAKLLLKRGATADWTGEGSALFQQAIAKGDKELIELFLEKGAHLNDVDKKTPLLLAIAKGDKELIKLFLEKGANINGAPENITTPLQQAILVGDEEIVTLLLDYGAKVDIDDVKVAISKIYCSKKIFELLFEKIPNINPDNLDSSLLLLAVERALVAKGKDIVELLLEYGANVNCADEQGTTPLLLAIKKGQKDIVKRFLEKGADAGYVDKQGKASLQWAIEKDQPEIIKQIIIAIFDKALRNYTPEAMSSALDGFHKQFKKNKKLRHMTKDIIEQLVKSTNIENKKEILTTIANHKVFSEHLDIYGFGRTASQKYLQDLAITSAGTPAIPQQMIFNHSKQSISLKNFALSGFVVGGAVTAGVSIGWMIGAGIALGALATIATGGIFAAVVVGGAIFGSALFVGMAKISTSKKWSTIFFEPPVEKNKGSLGVSGS